MLSKIQIYVDPEGRPMIRVFNIPDETSGPIDDVRDKLVSNFLSGLEGSPFAGVVNPRDSDGSYREIIPLTLGHAFEWMVKALYEECRDPDVRVTVMEHLDVVGNLLFKQVVDGPNNSVS